MRPGTTNPMFTRDGSRPGARRGLSFQFPKLTKATMRDVNSHGGHENDKKISKSVGPRVVSASSPEPPQKSTMAATAKYAKHPRARVLHIGLLISIKGQTSVWRDFAAEHACRINGIRISAPQLSRRCQKLGKQP